MNREAERLEAAFTSAGRVALRLRSSLRDDADELDRAINAEETELDRPLLRILDSFLQRYQQMQEQLTRRVFPALFRREERLRPPPFAQLLDWLEGQGIIDQAQRWFTYADTRNRLVHEYPLDDAERRAALKAARQQSEELLSALERALAYAARRGASNDG